MRPTGISPHDRNADASVLSSSGPPCGVAQPAHALVVRLAGLGTTDVLEQERDAPERPVRERAEGVVAGALELAMDHAVQLRIEQLDAGDRCVDELDRFDVATPHELGEAGRVVLAEVVFHGPTVSAARGRR